ncbi:unnamed protein product [Orchesella dallaii]|uniref:Tetraspanin n=1 Tax=Orchesella dallaii TaxID=48710 RepID=A0ABP1S528_9HEXA
METEPNKKCFGGCNVFIGLVAGLAFIGAALNAEHGISKYFAAILHREESTIVVTDNYIFLFAGIFMISTGILGFYGAHMGNRYLLSLYAFVMVLTLIVQLAAVIVFTKYDYRDIVRQATNRSLNNYYDLDSASYNESHQFWDYLQPNLECCGIDNYTDWMNASQAPAISFIPESCCKPSLDHDDDVTNCTRFITNGNVEDAALVEKFIYVNGCIDEYFGYYAVDLLGFYAIFLLFFQIFAIGYACVLIIGTRAGYRRLDPQIYQGSQPQWEF